jgi:hypothetical protein
VDFQKAFDTMSHESLFCALTEQGVPGAYVDLILRLYKGQTRKVRCDKMSREFEIGRGTKQGDPISPVLFNAVLESIMRKVVHKWARKGWGVNLAGGYKLLLQNLRFADDVLLIGRSHVQIQGMILDLQQEAAKSGLELNLVKTKVLNNGTGRQPKTNTCKPKEAQLRLTKVTKPPSIWVDCSTLRATMKWSFSTACVVHGANLPRIRRNCQIGAFLKNSGRDCLKLL